MNQYSELKFSETFSIFLGKIIGFICFLFFISTFPLNFAKFINPEIKIVLLLVVLFFISYIFFIDREKKIIFFFLALLIFLPSILIKSQVSRDFVYFALFLFLMFFISKKNSNSLAFDHFKKTLTELTVALALLACIFINLNFFLFLLSDFKYFNTIQGIDFGNYNIYTNYFGSLILKKWNFAEYAFEAPRTFFYFIEPVHAAIFLISCFFYFDNQDKNYRIKYLFLFSSLITFSGFSFLFLFGKILDSLLHFNNFFNKKIKINISLIFLIIFIFFSFINPNLLLIIDNFFSLDHRIERISFNFPIFFETYKNVIFGADVQGKYGVISGLFFLIFKYGLFGSIIYFYTLKKLISDNNTFIFFIFCSFFVQFQLFYLILPFLIKPRS